MQTTRYDETSVGDVIRRRVTITSWHTMTGAALFGDPGPNHVDYVHAQQNRFGARIVHGFTTTGQMMGVLGNHFGWSIEGFLETHIRFMKPIYENENVDVEWRVERKEDKEAFNGGILHIKGTAWGGEEKREAVNMDIKLAVGNAGPPDIGPSE